MGGCCTVGLQRMRGAGEPESGRIQTASHVLGKGPFEGGRYMPSCLGGFAGGGKSEEVR